MVTNSDIRNNEGCGISFHGKQGSTSTLGRRAHSITASVIDGNKLCGIGASGDTTTGNTATPFWSREFAVIDNTITGNGRSTLAGSGGIVFASCVNRTVQFEGSGGQFGFFRPSARAPYGAYV